jgi:hypothetical protein
MDGQTVIHEINSIFAGFALKRDFVVGYVTIVASILHSHSQRCSLSYLMTGLLLEAHFTLLERIPVLVPSGALSEIRKGLRGHSLTEYKDDVIDNLDGIFDQITKSLLSQAALEAPKGVLIQSEEDRKALLERFHHAFEQGVLFINCVWVAQK